jgi:hypothetical protein
LWFAPPVRPSNQAAQAVGIAKHVRAIQQTNVLSVMLSPDYLKLRRGLLEVGRAHPAARRAILKVLTEIEGEAPHMDGYPLAKQLEMAAAE